MTNAYFADLNKSYYSEKDIKRLEYKSLYFVFSDRKKNNNYDEYELTQTWFLIFIFICFVFVVRRIRLVRGRREEEELITFFLVSFYLSNNVNVFFFHYSKSFVLEIF